MSRRRSYRSLASIPAFASALTLLHRGQLSNGHMWGIWGHYLSNGNALSKGNTLSNGNALSNGSIISRMGTFFSSRMGTHSSKEAMKVRPPFILPTFYSRTGSFFFFFINSLPILYKSGPWWTLSKEARKGVHCTEGLFT
jgi:hypothetical protein